MSFKKEIVETYKEFGMNNEIEFDNKWWLFGFTNCVYDMKEEQFRSYKFDDYVSITCGYDWREPTNEELETVNNLLKTIMPIKEEREAYLQLLCTGIDGRCLEKFIIFNGSGGNGKGVMNDLMLQAVGNYGLLGNNGILFETSKTGSNPEKANMHKKRFVVFREPPEKHKFENSIVKELTGGGTFSARSHNEKETEKELNLTMIVECNKRPLFNEEPTDAEIRRIIDIFFRSKFTEDSAIVDESKYIFLANKNFKDKDFQQKHKYALIKILIEEHKKYKNNNYCLQMPKSIIDRTQLYLELSCNIVQWFKENYDETNIQTDILKVKDIFDAFVQGTYYFNLSKFEKKKYTKHFFVNYFETNIFLRKYYHERYNNVRNIVKGWKQRIADDVFD
jgi:phage/plasmid-associated DNA primase